jgi:D-alanyl-D-alanine carboxypeptidase/D-alanyl-D-alanine-endopeptidase (penicillin-binding protein 4)
MYSKSKSFNAFYNTLPVSGESGTLKNFLSSTTLKGKVHAKSGTISRVKSYVGYIKINDQTLAFAVLVNNANGSSKEVTSKIENLLVEVSSSFN